MTYRRAASRAAVVLTWDQAQREAGFAATYGMERDTEWMLDDIGHEQGGCCLAMTLRDLGRFKQRQDFIAAVKAEIYRAPR